MGFDHSCKAIKSMRAPSDMTIICIDVTNKCDLACSNCTRLLENQDSYWDMTPENFRVALQSLHGYPGIIAMIGGNPCMHPKFVELCKIFGEEIPNKKQRGLWTNNFFKHQAISHETFGVFNLNPHGEPRGIKSLESFRNIGWYHEGNSEHSPVLVAIQDLYGEAEMWERIAKCDVNQNWSATITQRNGELRYYFCEIAGAFDQARNEDHGGKVIDGWWRFSMEHFSEQVRYFCPKCGVAARIAGPLDVQELDMYTRTNEEIALKARKKNRKVIEIKSIDDQEIMRHAVTEYSRTLQTRPSLPRRLTRAYYRFRKLGWSEFTSLFWK